MLRNNYISSLFTRNFLLGVMLIYLVDYFTGGQISSYVALSPDKVIYDGEFWRTISFPFSEGNIGSTLLFFFTFVFFGPKVERNLGLRNYVLYLFLTAGLTGALLSIFFYNTSAVFSGMDTLSFFTMTSFILLNPKIKIHIHKISNISSVFLSLIFTLIWFSMSIFEGFTFDVTSSAVLFASPMVGVSVAAIISIIIRYSTREFELRTSEYDEMKRVNYNSRSSVDELYEDGLDDNDLQMALIAKNVRKKPNSSKDERLVFTKDASVNEAMMNELLDKIFASGEKSLSASERKYLEEYSKRL